LRHFHYGRAYRNVDPGSTGYFGNLRRQFSISHPTQLVGVAALPGSGDLPDPL
jgi:hypothetical protein